MNISIGENIRIFRKNMNIGQETLANAVGVSVQAVSKWETGQSLPDVGIIPNIAAFFKVSIDSLFFGKSSTAASLENRSLPNDDKLYVVQVLNGEILDREKWVRDEYISLAVAKFDGTLNAEIWGNASIKGDVNGNLSAGGNAACQNVDGCLNAGCDIACKDVDGSVCAGNSVACGNVVGDVHSGYSTDCGNVVGNVNAGNEIACGNIAGNVSANNNVFCGDISECRKISCTTIYAKGGIECDSIECGGDIHTEEKINENFN